MKKESLVFLVGAFGCLFIAVNSLFAQVWTPTSAPTNAWSSVACSADGARLVAAANQLAFSWIIPSTDFVLQQSSDLAAMNWTDVTNTPALNPANLQNQVALPLPAGNVFYRLKSP